MSKPHAKAAARDTLGTFTVGYDPAMHAVHATIPLAEGANADAVRDALGAVLQQAFGGTWDASNHLVVDLSTPPPHLHVLVHAHAHRREQHEAIERERDALRQERDELRQVIDAADASVAALLSDAAAVEPSPPRA